MSDKKLQISADLKIKTTEAERTLQKLQKEGVKISNILKGLDISTSGGRAGFAKSLLTANKEMVKLRGTTHDTAKVMEHVYGRQLEKQSKNLDAYTKKIERLNKQFKAQQYNAQFQSEVGNAALGSKYSAMASRTADKIVVAEAARQAIQTSLKDLKDTGSGSKPGGISVDTARLGVAIAQSVVGAMGQFAGTFQSGKTMYAQNLAATRGYENKLLRSMYGGDFSDMYFGVRGTGGKSNIEMAKDQAGGTGTGTFMNFANGVSGILGATGSALTLKSGSAGGGMGGRSVMTGGDYAGASSGIMGNMNQTFGAMQNQLKGGPQAMETAAQQAQIEAMKAQDPLSQLMLQNLQATAGMRVGAAKGLQGRHMLAAGIGSGFGGIDMGESFGLAQGLTRQFGMESISGGRNSLMANTLGLERKGIDRSVAGSALGNIMVAGGGGEKGMNAANKAVEDIMTKAFSRGIKDARIAEEFVKASGDLAFGTGGATKDIAQLGMMFSTNANSVRQAQMNVSGMEAASQLRDSNPYFKAVSAEAAKGVLGPNASGLQMMAVSKSSLPQLLGGSDFLESAGVSLDQSRGIAKQSFNSMFGDIGRSDDKATAPFREALLANKGDVAATLQDPRNAFGGFNKQAATFLHATGRGGGSFETALGLMNDLQGIDTKAEGKGAKNMPSHGDATAEAQVRAQQRVVTNLINEEVAARKRLLTALDTTSVDKTMAATKGGANADFKSAQIFMEQLIQILKEASFRMEHRDQNAADTSNQAGPR